MANQDFKIKGDVKAFSELNLKKFKKKNKDYYDGKKELKRSYFAELIDLLPKTIEWTLKNGHIDNDDVKTTKANIYAKFVSDNGDEFVEAIMKELKNDNEIENIKLLPIIIKDMLVAVESENAARVQDGRKDILDVSYLVELCKKILKKKIKKAGEVGVSDALAYDILTTIPCGKAFEYSVNYRINSLFAVLYEHAKVETVPFEKVMDEMIDDKFYKQIILFELLERKEKFGKLNDKQKELYLAITAWAFKKLNKMSKDDIEDILKAYVSRRKQDAAQGKDSNRRYAISTLSEDEYPNIAKIVSRIIANDDTLKTYLG